MQAIVHLDLMKLPGTGKLNGLEPPAYIAHVIEKMAQGWPAARWDDLMPWNWQTSDQPIAQAA